MGTVDQERRIKALEKRVTKLEKPTTSKEAPKLVVDWDYEVGSEG